MRRFFLVLLLLLPSFASSKPKDETVVRSIAALTEQGKFDEAEEKLSPLLNEEPANQSYIVLREAIRQKKAARLIKSGDEALAIGESTAAQQLFAMAYSIDPQNEYARQRFLDARGGKGPRVEVLAYDSPPELQPQPGVRSFDIRGDSRALAEQIARAYGLKVEFDSSFTSRQVRFTIQNASFPAALDAFRGVTKSFIVPLSADQFLVADDTAENRRRLERMALRTFYVPDAATPTDLVEVVNVLRMMFDLRQIMPNQANSTITVRAPQTALDAAQRLLQDLSAGRPEVVMDVQVIQITLSKTTNIGVGLPLQFTAFNVNTELRKLVSDPNVLALINQLVSGGQISPADAAALASLVSAAQNSGSPLLQGFATFGGGITRTGVVIPPATASFKLNTSDIRIFQKVSMRSQHGKPATYRIGDRYPVLTGTFTPLVNIPLPRSLQRQNNVQPLTPSFNYEDLGITFKATPLVGPSGGIRIDFDLALRALAGQTFNGVPAISNRQYTGSVTLMEGQTSVIAGTVSTTEQKAVVGLPLLSQIPGFRYALSTTTKDLQDAQLLVLVTPHRVRSGHVGENPEIVLPPAGASQ